MYLKIPLVVGESWDSHAAHVPDLSGDGVTMNMQARTRTFVVGKETVVLIEFDFEGDTVSRLGMPAEHRH